MSDDPKFVISPMKTFAPNPAEVRAELDNERHARKTLQNDIAALEARVTELQADNTRLENERRKYKTLHEASHKMLIAACVEIPLELATTLDGKTMPLRQAILEVHERNELLEADAWCNAASACRAFIADAKTAINAQDLVEHWIVKFGEVLAR